MLQKNSDLILKELTERMCQRQRSKDSRASSLMDTFVQVYEALERQLDAFCSAADSSSDHSAHISHIFGRERDFRMWLWDSSYSVVPSTEVLPLQSDPEHFACCAHVFFDSDTDDSARMRVVVGESENGLGAWGVHWLHREGCDVRLEPFTDTDEAGKQMAAAILESIQQVTYMWADVVTIEQARGTVLGARRVIIGPPEHNRR